LRALRVLLGLAAIPFGIYGYHLLVHDLDGNVENAGRSNAGICSKLFLSPKTVETRVNSIFNKLRLAQAPDDHRRVLAVLAYLRSEQ
jgi:hypothetical protein